MALRTRHLRVQSGERIPGLVVVELRDILPIFKVVALLAILPQAATVVIFMAVHAIRRNAQKGPSLIANLNREHFVGRDVSRCVATVTCQSRMLAHQVIASLAVVETGRSRCPFHDFEILAIMLGVAARAFLAGVGFQVVGSVQAVSRS